MYKHILIPLDNSPADEAILEHVKQLARVLGSKITLIHVAEGFAARYQESLNLAPSEEVMDDEKYLKKRKQELSQEGFSVNYFLDAGDPTSKIIEYAEKNQCDLIAMPTHGHKIIKDILLGSVASNVRHNTDIPVLLIKSHKH